MWHRLVRGGIDQLMEVAGLCVAQVGKGGGIDQLMEVAGLCVAQVGKGE